MDIRRVVLIVLLGVALPGVAGAADVLIQRPDGRYERREVPGTGPRERLDVRPVPGTGSAAVFDGRGRRVGTVESKPYGGAVLYDERGRRR